MFAEVTPAHGTPRVMSVGRSTDHREAVLVHVACVGVVHVAVVQVVDVALVLDRDVAAAGLRRESVCSLAAQKRRPPQPR